LRRTSTKSLLVLALAFGLVLSTVGAAVALPDPKGYGPGIDAYARYDVVAGECSSVEQPGVVEFRRMLQAKYGANGAGITRACNSSTRSAHQSGRAYDWMLDARRAEDRAKADEVLGWLLATDDHGNRHAMARRLGVMYIIWNHRMWSAWNADAGWQPYNGWSPHTDHIHFSFSWPGARQQTSFWTQTEPVSLTGFRDVPVGSHYEDAVMWLVENGITHGRSPGVYDPSGSVTRAQMAAFLWNLMEQPATATTASFSDVPTDAFYSEAVAWLDLEGITTGRADGTFAPRELVNRGQMASFLWRLAGRPTAESGTPFADVHPSDHYAQAAAWMAQHGITTGTSTGLFQGHHQITRSQMALFLHRLATSPAAWSDAPVVPASVR
jgi:hypothetical protein